MEHAVVAIPAWPRLQDLDAELFEEYVLALGDYAPQIERHVAQPRAAPAAAEPLTALFRLFHNLKGDASLCRFDLGLRHGAPGAAEPAGRKRYPDILSPHPAHARHRPHP